MKEKFWKIVDENLYIIFFIIITIFSMIIRFNFMGVETQDYHEFLSQWFEFLKNNGGLLAVKNCLSDYNAPYLIILALLTYIPISPLYLIKTVSIIFDYILATSCMILVYKLFKQSKNSRLYGLLVYIVVIMLPTVILNSSAWSQCDSMYATFAIISLIYLMDEKYVKSFIFLGISFSLKLQFIFLIPVYILIYITKRKFSIYHFLIVPITNFVLCIPAMLLGKSISSCMAVYGEQMKSYNTYISLNFSGIYNLFFKGENLIYFKQQYLAKSAIFATITIFAVIALIFLYKKVKINQEDIITLSLWSVMICTFFLPHMHDRYLFLGDILSVIYFIINRDKWYIPIGVNFVSLYSYSAYLWGNMSIEIVYVTILNFILLLLVTKDVYENIIKNKKTSEIKEDNRLQDSIN